MNEKSASGESGRCCPEPVHSGSFQTRSLKLKINRKAALETAIASTGLALLGWSVVLSPAHRTPLRVALHRHAPHLQSAEPKTAAEQALAQPPAPAAPPLRVSLDARLSPVGPSLSGSELAALAHQTAEADPKRRSWAAWAFGSGKRLRVASARPAEVQVYSERSGSSIALLEANVSAAPVPTVTAVRLPRGVYTVERLNLPSNAEPVLEIIQGKDLPRGGLISKPALLMPGEACIYRFIDRAETARGAARELRQALDRQSPSSARSVNRILRESGGALGGLLSGSQAQRLTRINVLLLHAAQAQAVQRNFVSRGAVSGRHGVSAVDAFAEFTENLAETGAVILGIAPHIRADAGSFTSPAHGVTVSVSLDNYGGSSVSLVKLGLDTTALPSGVFCDSPDPAIFHSLRPGQTVRAQFALKSTLDTLPTMHCTGDISFFVAGGPAHLRPQTW